MRLAYNFCCDSYILSEKGISMYNKLSGSDLNVNHFSNNNDHWYKCLDDHNYIKVIETLGKEASLYECVPKIITVADDLIEKYSLVPSDTDFYKKVISIYIKETLEVSTAIPNVVVNSTMCAYTLQA